MNEKITEKLAVLANAAKYDVSCASSGSYRKNHNKGLGDSTGMGICHTYTEDGRCVSLLKILLTNFCIYDCAYCVSRKSNDVKRAAFTVKEVVELTMNFYRRNYIEGLFLSSGIFKDADYTMERLVRVAKDLREQKFNGYIHLKTIPGASNVLMHEAGLYADRLSVNMELPTETSLKLLAPDKNYKDIITPMNYLTQTITEKKEERKVIRRTPLFAPAGQSTQMIVGASAETDKDIMFMSSSLYNRFLLRRVYYSGYVPVSTDVRLPQSAQPLAMMRENRLYQTDWLLRFYGFNVNELFDDQHLNLDYDIDPKLSWALRNLHLFPVDVNKAPKEMLLRIPGVGAKSVAKILMARKFRKLSLYHLAEIGIAVNRAKHFFLCADHTFTHDVQPEKLRRIILSEAHGKYSKIYSPQLSLFQ